MLLDQKETTRFVETDQFDLAKEKMGSLEPMWPQEKITALFDKSAAALEKIRTVQQR